MEYDEFLRSKTQSVEDVGFDVDERDIHPILFPFQKAAVVWALKKGRCALFEDCGLGKGIQQLEWARHVHIRTGGIVLILAPLAVSQQTIAEALKLGMLVRYAKVSGDITEPGVWVTNYERLAAFLDIIPKLAGIVADESGILKSYMGKTRLLLTEVCQVVPYRLCCTATPAPNDHMELGNHAEFLSIMPANEMLSRWFINDTMAFGSYRLKGHAVGPFWEWVSTWAVCAGTPADLGYPDDRFILPPLNIEQHLVDADLASGAAAGALFRQVDLNATSVHREMRLTARARASVVRDMVMSNGEPWIVWCHTNYEADELTALMPEAIEVRGSEVLERKEQKLTAFSTGRERVLISKPSICGFGLNWQHCAHVAFVGMSYSFESYYQALRRVYRFGQQRTVNAHLVMAETESPVWEVVRRKAEAHERMQLEMFRAANAISNRGRLSLRSDCGDTPMSLPSWLAEAA